MPAAGYKKVNKGDITCPNGQLGKEANKTVKPTNKCKIINSGKHCKEKNTMLKDRIKEVLIFNELSIWYCI